MVRLQHRVRRDGGITVGSTHYKLDAEGCVEVSDEHAQALRDSRDLIGPDWGKPGSWQPVSLPQPAVGAAKGAGRRPRTREELAEASAAAGVPPAAPKPTPAPPPPVEPEEETLELSLDNTKADLEAAAKELGVDLPRWATKAKILELIEAAQEE